MNLVFLKLGGSYLTDKETPGVLREERARRAGRGIRRALEADSTLRLVLAHGAGSFGHIPAHRYRAVEGPHPDHGWEGFRVIRRSMSELSLRLVEIWSQEELPVVALQPSALLVARDRGVDRMELPVLTALLEAAQVPVIHGDIVVDRVRKFTILSTETQLAHLASRLPVRRILMVTDVPGVLDQAGRVLPGVSYSFLGDPALSGARTADVTGGMRHKVESLLEMLRIRPGATARILGGDDLDEEELAGAILGRGDSGSEIRLQDL